MVDQQAPVRGEAPTTHPSAALLARLAAANPDYAEHLRSAPDERPGWVRADTLGEAAGGPLTAVLEQAAKHYPSPNRRAPAMLWFGNYSYAVMAVALAAYGREQRVPDLTLSEVWVRFSAEGRVAGLAWTGERFAALPEDPDAGNPNCTVRPTPEALRQHLLEAMAAHLRPLVEAVRAQTALGRPGLWALAADYCAYATIWLAERAGNAAAGVDEARRLTDAASPLRRKRDFVALEHGGQTHWMLDRASCCLYYQVEGGGLCHSCPHRPVEERVRLEREHLEAEGKDEG